MGRLIEVSGLTKRFGSILAVDRVSFSVDRGDVLGFLGPNGAGKTTTMRMITGFLPADAGSAKVCDFDVAEHAIQARAHIGYLPEGAPLYGDMTPLELLRFVVSVRGMASSETPRRIAWAASELGLEPVLHQPIETLSKGYKRRVGFAQAIVHDPDILILDEPTDGLDPNQKHEVRKLIRSLAREKAIIISTHILEEVDAVCSRAMVISRGKVVVDETPARLAQRSRHHNAVRLVLRGVDREQAQVGLANLDKVAQVELEPAADEGTVTCMVLPKDGASIVTDVSGHVQAKGWSVESMAVEPGRLDDVFRKLTTNR